MSNAVSINARKEHFRESVIISCVSMIISLIIGAILLYLSGYSPMRSYATIFGYSLGSLKGFALSLSQATPLLFTGLSFAIAYKVKMINTGAEGQLYLGAITAALTGYYFGALPSFLLIPICFISAALAGGLAAAFVAFLKNKFGASEIILTLMMNEVIIYITSYLANGPFKAEGSVIAQTERISETAKLSKLIPQTQLTSAFILGIAIALMLQFMLNKTVFGYEIKVTGYNLKAARTAGINAKRTYFYTFFISGAVAALGGAALVLGVNYRFVEGFSQNFGFGGISVAALAGYSPAGVILSSFLIGVMKAGSVNANRITQMPTDFVSLIQVLVVIFVAAPMLIKSIGKIPSRVIESIKKRKSEVVR